ncbi:MAG: ABC transporter ATP-binding protein [Planctomycetes bacterium]|nr:ABC transporter ATP-binding protein [Planctomycetota bacterium]
MSVDRKVKLTARGIAKVYFSKKGDFAAVRDISLDVLENEFLVLLGPGQCGKSVFLHMISGLEEPTAGELTIDGERVAGRSDKLSMVFQRIAILPWKSSLQNAEMGPKYHGVSKAERRRTSREYLKMVGLEGFENHFPRQLSGGMKQRVGIARAYNANPEIFLMDEPFGSLDAQTRYQMQDEILRIWEQDRRTVIFVTNNIEEALYLGDRIILFSRRPAVVKEIYDLSSLGRPRSNVAREFLQLRKHISENMDLDLD